MLSINTIARVVVNTVRAASSYASFDTGLLLAPDKEAAAVFVFLGYYPIVKLRLDKMQAKWLWKGLLFNGSVLIMYWLLMHLFGFAYLTEEFSGMGFWMLAVLLILGNVTFFLLDRLLGMRPKRRK